MISQHKFEERMVPKFFWFDLLLHASLYSIYGVPVSICACRTLLQRERAWICFLNFFSSSYFTYSFSNSSPYVSAKPGHSSG